MDESTVTIIVFGIAILVVVWLVCKNTGVLSQREFYRDPIFLDRKKLTEYYYPRTNGSIYGLPYHLGGSWSIFSGYPYYDRAY